jgi:5-(carboxyamino)imidazole ribonucleotide mutase
MPAGVPVATVSVGGARNAGLLAVRALAADSGELGQRLRTRMAEFQRELETSVLEKHSALQNEVDG